MYSSKNLCKFEKNSQKENCDVVTYYYDLKAPLSQNTVVGKAYLIDENGVVLDESDLIILEDVAKNRFNDYVKKIISRW